MKQKLYFQRENKPNFPFFSTLVITTNKSPNEWAEVLKDTVLTTALLDRLLHRCEIVKLSGVSSRMRNIKTIFLNQN